ncbi:MAG: isoleucine--tRNA ligase [Clostridia bacterium]|nr:isoleucine--tRNA ligase [Clostridia bacterium]
MYKKVDTNLNFANREDKTIEFWKQNDIFQKSIDQRSECELFTFYDGPPTANGKPHIGHVLTRAIKDLIPRYKTMKGYQVLRKAGWDTHGLPVELEVEKVLGINGKPEIEKYGVEPFIKKCKESVWKYQNEWEVMSEKVGFWADMKNPYVTYDDNYIESEWWALKTIWDKGLLYKGYKIIPYCPRCGTSLSSHEVAQGYQDVKETSIYVKFTVRNMENTYFVAWTTTPWTLPSNSGLTVGADIDYVKVDIHGEFLILAKELAKTLLDHYHIVEEYKGSDLEHMEYEPLFDFGTYKEKGFYVCLGDFVTLSEGTGIVHTAPAFGEDDARVGKAYKLPFIQYVNEQGLMTEETQFLAGKFVKEADQLVIDDLEKRGHLLKAVEYEHSYPFCWRCDTPLIYYARNSWFIEMTKLRDNLLVNNSKINWIPQTIGENRFGNFLKNVVDWGISRERYWGTPLPIWECSCGHRHAIGSKKELMEMSTKPLTSIELHKPYIDEVLIECPKCGSDMKRVSEVIDCWFDSGSMPFAQWHYPFENKDKFENNFPADFISEAVDQTRGWFYTLLAISTLLFDEAPFKNVIVLGHVQDKNGVKMSKHTGNVIEPLEVINNQGADAVRWYFYTASAPWLPSRFYHDAVSEGQRKFMGTFWNTYAFYIIYADIDKFNPTKYTLEYEKLSLMDKWILSLLNTLIKDVDNDLNNYRITEAGRSLQKFVDELSNWYIRRSRERFWQGEENQDKINAYMTLYTVLTNLTLLAAPFVPFMTEDIYQNLVRSVDVNAKESVHLCLYPKANESYISKDVEKYMNDVLEIVVLGRSIRNTANLKNRQPLSKIYVSGKNDLPELYMSILLEELNIKKVEFVDDASEFIDYKLKPQLKTLGRKYGKLIPKIYKALEEADGGKVMKTFAEGKSITFVIDGEEVILESDDVLSETIQKKGYVSLSENDVTVVVDTNLTDALIEEGFVREIISKVQTMRKEASFEVVDNIEIAVYENAAIENIVKKNWEFIASETLAQKLFTAPFKADYEKEWNINGEVTMMSVKKV